ncbi:Protodermal factor 1 [Quillaja saponaria]|uniref:Protodermal factor 1 n=1 Tax=Quillaja saponaria TaxID=32244 RepID=A0AAD7PM60_QUISA|nr:Protodermal factor 1 [Quillaja saponaria]
MEGKRSMASLFLLSLLAGLLSQNLVIPVMSASFEDQKNYYSPDPHAGSPPTGSHGSPPHGTPPSHGGGYGGTPPSHPSHGGYNPTPSTPPGGNCPTPPLHDPHIPTPRVPSNPPSGGGYYHSPPSHDHPHTPTPRVPSNPPSGGGYYHSPPISGGVPPPSPITISPPTTPTPVIVSPPTTPTPVIVSPPTTPTPIDPGTPTIPTPPFLPAPSPPFIGTCNYWRNHPGIVWGLLGWWGTLGNAFGVTSLPGFGTNLNLLQALSNTRADGLGALYREGTAAFLNSMVNNRFPFTTKQVTDRFVAALSSNKASAAQAQLFKLANEGRLKPRP